MRPVSVFVAPGGNAFMRDIAAWLVEAARITGRDAELVADGRRPSDHRRTNLVVAPHEFYALGGWTDAEVDESVRASVPVCTEQPGTRWFDITVLYARRSPFAIDINAHGVDALAAAGITARHLRLGGVPSIDHRRPDRDRSVELLFLGGRTDRRDRIVAELAPMLWARDVQLRMFTFARPVSGAAGGLVFGDAKYDLLADARILLNLHRDDAHPGYFEWARMVEAMANGCCVLTEPSTAHEPLVAGTHFVESTDMAADLAALLDDPDRCAEVGARAATAVLDEHPLTAALEPLLAELDTPTITGITGAGSAGRRPVARRRRVAPRYRATTVRLEQRPLLPPFTPNDAMRARVYRALVAETQLARRIDGVRCLHRHGTDDHVERFESAAWAGAVAEVSVVVTLYGYAHLVAETLASIAASDNVAAEIVVVDDHSRDDGRAVVRRWMSEHPDVPVLLLGSDVNRGLPASRNLGFEAARADRVMVMDADNLVYPTALRRLADALDADPAAAFAYSMLEEFGTGTGLRSAMGWSVEWLCEGNYIDAQAMIRRSAWERLGGYLVDDDLLFGWEDWELWLRLAAEDGHGTHVPQVLGRYRTQERSMLSTTNLVADGMLAHLRERYPALPWAPWL